MQIKPRKIWEKGTDLNKAWLEYATENERQKYLELNNHKMEFGNDIGRNIQLVGNLLNRPNQIENLKDELRNSLIQKLKKGDLLAFGYSIYPTLAGVASRIENEFWMLATCKWENDEAHSRFKAYHRIKIINPDLFPDLDLIPEIGRPSKAAIREKAILRCIDKIPEFELLTHKEKAELIRAEIKEENPDIDPYGPGYGDDVIKKQVNKILKSI
ncbi:hypothetical protein GCM10017044_08600 [Kordiimonas sediminis]|uniref:Uncharacterized protein n=1 Tax=Kordiimonas sediminis TaxID=1735581 RepID=A0A919AP92_9PROT|nr:hypothetical protein [Kordiimonas sediminis]GHF16574.1 hypothetical protein GCM10017044_08600 [Kordiimonas sediminis]